MDSAKTNQPAYSSTIIPDQRSCKNVEFDYPDKAGHEKFRLAQADMLLRLHGYERQKDGSYAKPEGAVRKRTISQIRRGGRSHARST
jgi:hypothetical protein